MLPNNKRNPKNQFKTNLKRMTYSKLVTSRRDLLLSKKNRRDLFINKFS